MDLAVILKWPELYQSFSVNSLKTLNTEASSICINHVGFQYGLSKLVSVIRLISIALKQFLAIVFKAVGKWQHAASQQF